MKYEFVEIGTSDFRYLAGKENGPGMSIEPRKEHLDRLPTVRGNVKVEAAIGRINGRSLLYFVPDEVVAEKGWPEWTKGCSRIGYLHRGMVDRYGKEYTEAVETRQVRVRRLETVLVEHEVESIEYLKVDAEGMDAEIVEQALDSGIRIQKIQFEDNGQGDSEQRNRVVKRLQDMGYQLYRNKSDIVANL